MVVYNFKKVNSVIHLESYTSYKEYEETRKIRVPIDSFICYSIQKFVTSKFVSIRFIPIRTETENQKPSVTLVAGEGEKFTFLINEYEIPWTVALCEYPVAMVGDIIITGLCAVARQICMFRNSCILRQEHEDGLLGFRQTCLQAPNEVSVWTKFCEIEIIRAVKEILTGNDMKEVPEALVRFEDHMRQPVRIHNVYKVAQNLKRDNLNAENEAKGEQQADVEVAVLESKNEPETYLCGSNFSAFVDKAELAEINEKVAMAIHEQHTNAEREMAKQTEQKLKSKHEIVVEQQANAEQTEQKVGQQEITGQTEHRETTGQTEQKVKSKHETIVEQQANAEKTEQKGEHHTSAGQREITGQTEQRETTRQTEQNVKSKHEIIVEQQANAEQTEQKVEDHTCAGQREITGQTEQRETTGQTEQKVKSKHETIVEQQANAEKTEQKVEDHTSAGQREITGQTEQRETTGQTEQKVKSKYETIVEQQANAEQTEQKAEHHTSAGQREITGQTEQRETTGQTEQKVKSKQAEHQTNAEKKVKSKSKHDKNEEHEESAKLQENVVKTEKRLKSKHQKSADKESEEVSSNTKRASKPRKWKSLKNKDIVIDCSTRIENLDINHEFAEGPYLTLADLVLLPSYHVIIQSIGEAQFESLLPFTYKWYKNLISINYIQKTFMCLMSHFNLQQLQIDNMTIPIADDVSLYKCDPKRHNSKKRIYTNNDDIEKALSSITNGLELPMCDNEYQPTFKWHDIPEPANPFAGYLPSTRVQRKSEQLQNLALPVIKMATDGDVIVDFCCGTGHLGILLAYLLPRCTIILLDNKIQSLCRAKERVQKMRLRNVYYYQCNLDFFTGEFDIGIGLHACGIATDLILDKCLKQNARFVLSPCCYGAIHGTCRIEYPRSKKFANVSFDDYLYIAHGADQTHKEHPLAVRGARCMKIIDSDRGHLAEEFGYKVTLMTLKPVTCTPKNNLLIGISTEK